jgi:predicted ATPase
LFNKITLNKKIIVLTGGPGTGKTTLLNALIEKKFVCFPEISREVTLAAQKVGIDQLFLEKPLLFSEMLLNGRLKQFIEAQNSKANIVFLDRGLPDVLAYMDYIGDSFPEKFKVACQQNKYTHVFLLPPWKEIYKSDEARYENFEQASKIYENLKDTYRQFGYTFTEVPPDSVENRINFILNAL